MTNGEAPVICNQSEISSAFLVCGVWALMVDATQPRDAGPAGGHLDTRTVSGRLGGVVHGQLGSLRRVAAPDQPGRPTPRRADHGVFRSAAALLVLSLAKPDRSAAGVGHGGRVRARDGVRRHEPAGRPAHLQRHGGVGRPFVVAACVWLVTVFPTPVAGRRARCAC